MEYTQFQALLGAIQNNLNLRKVGAGEGTYLVTGTSATPLGGATTIQPREATVISAMTGTDPNGAAVNFVTLFNVSGATLNTVDLLIAPDGYRITSITLTSGSVLIYS
jgi:hypothetical protein